MLDHRLFSTQFDSVAKALLRRGVSTDVLLDLQKKIDTRRESIARTEALRNELNEKSQALAHLSRSAKGHIHETLSLQRAALKTLKADIQSAEQRMREAEAAFAAALLNLPNTPLDSVPDGHSEADNRIDKVVGDVTIFDGFAPRAHDDVLEGLGLLDFTRAAKLSGARFYVLRGRAAELERALSRLMLDLAKAHGYQEMAVPYLVSPASMQAACQYPKFKGDAFETQDGQLVLIPTSEVALVNLHRDEIIALSALPIRYTALTPCFRKESGAAGRDTKGLVRQHQFNKVELVSLTTAEASLEELEKLVGHAEAVLERLELPYRRVSLCTADLGFAAAKTYDLEVWLPGQNAYREISSCSSCGDFQARRAQIRHRLDASPNSRTQLVHTLNGSALAVGRTLVAVVENYQRHDGHIDVPKALVPYMDGATQI